MFSTGCPTADKLEGFAKRPSKGRLSEHVESCPICHKIVEDIRDETRLVVELQQAATAGLTPAVRQRLQSISREAVRDPGNGQGRSDGL